MRPLLHSILRAACGVVALVALVGLGGCDPATPGGEGASAGVIKLDEFCATDGLSPALRHTTLIVDAGALQPASPEDFREKNPEFFRLAIGVADPMTAIASGAAAPRERITILAASPRTATLTPVFTGCLPGVSAGELTASAGSAGQKYFGSDLSSRVNKQQQAFQRQLLVSLMTLNKLSEAPSALGVDFATSPMVKLLKPLGAVSSDDPAVRRLFIFTDLRRSPAPSAASVAEARAAGFAAAAAAGVKLGQAEAYIVSPGAPPEDTAAQFFETFLLGSQADLRRVGGFSPNALLPAPAVIASYRGTLEATSALRMPMTLRIAATKDGELVNSWIGYTASMGQRTTPVAGEWRCQADQTCELRSDAAGGLGQLWRITPGEQPEVREDAPLGGLRFIEGRDSGGALKGRIYDPVISIGRPGGAMTFQAQRVAG